MNLERFIESQVIWFLSLGLVWIGAWLFNPNIDSGFVWLLAFIFASINTDLYVIRRNTNAR